MTPPADAARLVAWELTVLAPVVAGALILGVTFWSLRAGSPRVSLLARWVRWLVFSLAMSAGIYVSGFDDRPYVVLLVATALIWFLVESVQNWFLVKALSEGVGPIFPPFTLNRSGDEWPAERKFLRIRQWLRSAGLRPIAALKAEGPAEMVIRSSVFQDATDTIRVQVTFLPQPGPTYAACLSFTSVTEAGDRIVTDNLFLPFGGFYPEHFEVVRRPLVRDPGRLFAFHRARLAPYGGAIAKWDTDPLADANTQQRLLEQTNTEMGFLMPHGQREEKGRISPEGRVRVWKEIFMLHYLGMAHTYRD